MLSLALPWLSDAAPRSIAEGIASDLGRRIVEGRLSGGEVLTEVEVGAEHGVSRTPAREAFLRLEAWGLVRLLPKKGALVTVPGTKERYDLLAFRSMIERNAVHDLVGDDARRGELVARLRDNLERQRVAVAAPGEFALLDYAFHAEIVFQDGNEVVDEIAASLAPRLLRLTYLAVSARPERLESLHDEHSGLLDAIDAGDAAAFDAAIERHLAEGHGVGVRA
jgi:DNA-binding GntR family transcriptional regulator